MIETTNRSATRAFLNLILHSARPLAAMTLPFQRAVLKRRLGRIVVEGVDGVDILVLPETFNPVVFRSGAFFAAALEAVIASPAGNAQAVLDMGAGSGVGAVFAARAGAMVTAVDINSEACRCARINAAIHGLEDRITVLEGDLFAPVAGRRFDVVLFNPPFFRGTPKSNLDRAWRSEDVLERFARGVGSVLAPGGKVVVVLSSHGEGDRLIRLLAGERFASRIVQQRDFGTEVMTVYEAWRLAK